MLLTVGIVNLLSHVAPLFTGQDVSLHLNKLQPVEVIRHWIGESNTSAFQQQQLQHQLKMLLSGGGEGGGITSPITLRGGAGISKEDQLPRGSRQSVSASTDEKSSLPHLSNTPSKRIRPSSDDITESNVDTSQRLSKKARLSHNSGQRPSEEQGEISSQTGGLNISQDSIDRSSIFQGGDNEGWTSSEQASRAVQNAPSFDDLVTQAIQAVTPEASSPVKKNTSEAQLTSQQTSAPAAAVNQTPEVISVVPVEQSSPTLTTQAPTLISSPSALISADPVSQVTRSSPVLAPSSQVAPSVTTESMKIETANASPSALTVPVETTVTNDVETVSDLAIPLTSQQAPAAAVGQTLTVDQPIEKSISIPPVIQEKTQALVPAPTSSTPASISVDPAPQLFISKKAPLLIESTTMQVDPVVIPEPVEEETTNDDLMTEALSSAAKEAMKRLTNLFNSMSSEDVEAPSSTDSDFKQSASQQASSEIIESMEVETTTTSTNETTTQPDPSVSADPDRQEHKQKMSSVAEELRKQFNQRQVKSGQNTQNSEEAKSKEMKSDPSVSADPAQRQQRRSLFDEMKGFQFNNGQKKKSQAKQKPEEQKKSMVDELKERFKRKQGATTETKAGSSSTGSMPHASVSVHSGRKFSISSRQDNSLARELYKMSTFETQLKEAISKGVSGLRPIVKKEVQVQKETSSTPMPQKPAFMKKSELGKKSSLATIATPETQLNELILKQEKLEKSIEWHKNNVLRYNPKVHLEDLRVIKGKISLLKIQLDGEKKSREKKAATSIAHGIAPSSISKDVKEGSVDSTAQSKVQIEDKKEISNSNARSSLSSLLSSTRNNLLEGIESGVQLKHVDTPAKKAKKRKEPTNDLERALFSRRQVMEDDDLDGESDDESDDEFDDTNRPSLQNSEPQPEEEKKAGVETPPPPPSSAPPPPLTYPEVKENKRSILQSIQNFRREKLKKFASSSRGVSTDSTDSLPSPEKVNVSSTTTAPILDEKKNSDGQLSLLGRSFNNFLSRFNLRSDDSAVDEKKQNLPPSTASGNSDDDDWED